MQAKTKLFFYALAILLMASITCSAQNPRLNALFNDLKNAKNDTDRINAYNHIAIEYRYLSPDTAMNFAKKGLALAQKIKYKLGEGKSTGDMGIIFQMQDKFDLANEYTSKALLIFQQLNYVPGITNSLNELGTIAGRRGSYDTATRYFIQAQKIEEKNHDLHGLMQTYMKLGVTSDESDNLDEALDYYQKLLKLNEVVKDDDLGIDVYNNIGIIYGKKEDYKKALEYFQLALADSTHDEGLRLKTYTNLGITYGKLGEIDKALRYQTEVLQTARARHLPEDECRSLINMANLYERRDPAKAIIYLDQARVLAEQAGQKDMLLSLMASMGEVYKNSGHYKEALDILEKQRNLSNELFSIKKAKEIGNLQATYELEKSKNRVQDLEIINRKNELQRNIIFIVALFLIIIFIIVFFFYSKTKKLNAILTKQKEELKGLNTIKDKLFSIIGHDLRAPMASIVSMLSVWESNEFSDAEKKKVIENLKTHSKVSLDTLDKLLYWGQAQIKGIRLQQTQFNPKEPILKNLELIADSAQKKHIMIIDNTDAHTSIYADLSHFDFVIRNLLSNAVKFTRINGVIEISATPGKPDGYTTFSIKDNGVGINKDRLNTIFETTNNSTLGTANEKGTSIGLILCKEYIIENGGRIYVSSEEDKGSVFSFTLKNNP